VTDRVYIKRRTCEPTCSGLYTGSEWSTAIPVVVQRLVASYSGRWRHSLAGWSDVWWRHPSCRQTTRWITAGRH